MLASLVVCQLAVTVPVDWEIPVTPATSLDPITVEAGDELQFKWVGVHNVFQSDDETAFNACSETNGQDGTLLASDSPYTTIELTTGTKYYVCTVGDHCSQGQKIQVNVVAPGTLTATPTSAPTPAPLGEDPCFPSSATVTLATGNTVSIGALKEGDEIVAATARGSLSTDTVSLLSIRRPDATARTFVRLTTDAKHNLTLTGEHRVPTGDSCCSNLKLAREISVGQTVWVAHAQIVESHRVVRVVQNVVADGLHSPVLTHGGLPVVNGVVTAFDRIESVTLASYALPLIEGACRLTGTCGLVRRAFELVL